MWINGGPTHQTSVGIHGLPKCARENIALKQMLVIFKNGEIGDRVFHDRMKLIARSIAASPWLRVFERCHIFS